MEKISIIVPSYNCAKWLPRCLDSMLAQTYKNIEIIVVNDGSSDNTREILDAYESRYPNIKAIHKSNGGEYKARLTGVDHAAGSWIGFIDADDEAESWMFERLIHNAQTYDADISHCGFKVIYPNGDITYLHNTGMLRVQDKTLGLRDLLEDKIVESGLPGKLFKKKLFDGLESQMDFSVVNNGDMLMNYYLFERAERSVLEDVCPYHYLIRQGSASRRKLNKHIIYDPIHVRDRILQTCDPEMRDDARAALARMCLVAYRQIVMEDMQEYKEDRLKIRELIAQQFPYLRVLPLRNALLVILISKAPWVFDLLYPPFERLFRRNI